MSRDRIAAIAQAVLYEGYILYPYRPSALKNRQRWTFGSLFPRAAAGRSGETFCMQTQCLVRGTGEAALSVRLRFLHLVQREVGALSEPLDAWPAEGEPAFAPVAALRVDDETLLAWDEAVERDIPVPKTTLAQFAQQAVSVAITVPGSRSLEPVRDRHGRIRGVILRSAAALAGTIEFFGERLEKDLFRVTCRFENTTPLDDAMPREAVQRRACASTHIILTIRDGAFLSLTDPPAPLHDAAAACDNRGCWPVLVGEEGSTDTLLAAPIILPDYPQIAPESPGDLFDGCEIDEMLTLRILTMTDAEKQEMAAADPRARALLERTESLSPAALGRLHGALRSPDGPARPRLASVARGGARLAVGDRVTLRPRARADIMDVVLDGMIATIESIERDFEDRIHLAVTVLDDPGRDLGMDRYPGHRFFFSAEEVEPLAAEPTP